ncbi:MAG: glucose-6-phosphate dehydrogenase [Candidatus Saccharimonadales bacterium]
MKQVPTAPSALVIFGVTGNLSQHMLLPALYNLEREQLLPPSFSIVGIFRREVGVDDLLAEAARQMSSSGDVIDKTVLDRLKHRFHSVHMDSTDPDHYSRLVKQLDELDTTAETKLNHLYYLAVPPNIFTSVIANLAGAGLNRNDDRQSRILVEKPFGDDLASATELIEKISQNFAEEQIFRIDHYLAKETAQNILTFRLSNPLIEAIWSRQFIDHIQISATEKIDIEGRSAFYENMGALRDFVQSHLMQLMALVMMEYPEDMTSESIHKEKLRLLENIDPIAESQIQDVAVRGQYAGYADEAGSPDSTVETFAALKLEVTNSRWKGVPVLLRTGKALTAKSTEIVVFFKDRTHRKLDDNLLKIRIQPNEGIALDLLAKKPGFDDQLQPVEMDFSYSGAFEGHQPDAYQRVLIDAMRGDRSLFATSDEVLASWRLLQPILNSWKNSPGSLESYEKGTWGPSGADTLAQRYDSTWLNT